MAPSVDRAQMVLDALAEGGDRLLDDGAPLLLLLHARRVRARRRAAR